VKSRHSAFTSSIPFVIAASRPGRTRSSANSTCATASSSAASVPGRIATHSSACSAVPVRRGSITITFPPRARIASSRASSRAREQAALRRVWVRAITTR